MGKIHERVVGSIIRIQVKTNQKAWRSVVVRKKLLVEDGWLEG